MRRSANTPAISPPGASRAIPHTPAVDPGLALNWNPFSETWKNLAVARENRVVWLSMLGISWFWFYGAIFLAQFAGFARDVLGGDEHVVTFLLALLCLVLGTGCFKGNIAGQVGSLYGEGDLRKLLFGGETWQAG